MKPTHLQRVLSRTQRRARHVPILGDDNKRTHCVSVRLSLDELALLDESRVLVKMRRGEFLRVAGLDELPHYIPTLNRQAWADLARVAANLNQLLKYLNAGDTGGDDHAVVMKAICETQALRKLLIFPLETS